MKQALEDASLGHHYPVFQEQEVDYQLFITMNDKDLAEMGILDSSDRARLLALIAKLTRSQKNTSNVSSGVPRQGIYKRERERERESVCVCVRTLK